MFIGGGPNVTINGETQVFDGTIKIDGKVISAGGVDLRGSSVVVSQNGGIVGVVNADKMEVLSSLSRAEQLFNTIVNTDNLNTANTFASTDNGNIIIRAAGDGTGDLNENGLEIAGTVKNFATGTDSSTELRNYDDAANGLKVSGTVANAKGRLFLENNESDLNVTGTLKNNGTTQIYNTPKQGSTESALNLGGNVNTEGTLTILNKGKNGLNLNGTVDRTGTADVENGYRSGSKNTTAGLNINGTFKSTGEALFYNTADGIEGLNISKTGNVEVGSKATFTNYGQAGLNIEGKVYSDSDANASTQINFVNTGEKGINIKGDKAIVDATKIDVSFNNTGVDGINLSSTSKINGYNVNYTNTGADGINLQGLTTANKNVTMDSTDSNITIGDTTKNIDYVKADQDISINIKNGSLLNYGVEKTLLVAGGDLSIDVTDGTIGLPVQQAACEGDGCTGIGPMSEGSRDFTKSVNSRITGKVNAKTLADKKKNEDLVVNYASVDSDMKIDTISADGRAILTVDDSGHAYGEEHIADGKRYAMLNARTYCNDETNVTGTGISLISNGNIGTDEYSVTYIQTGAENGKKMDVLANEDIYLKENSFTDKNYGKTKEVAKNEVCTVISREGDVDIEFSGNTHINNITAEGDLTAVTRGKTIEIDNLGHIDDDSVTPNDYFGPRHDGYEFDAGYDKDDYKAEVLPNHAVVKALDINHNIRTTEEVLDGGYEAYANSTAIVHSAVLDNGTLDITADNVYAINNLIDISRGGIALTHDSSIKTGDIIPVLLTYGDIDINANVEVVTVSNSRAGAKFVNLDKSTANKLLYLSMLLENEREGLNIQY